MPNPAQSDLHVNVPLTNVSVAYVQSSSAYIADKVFPKVPVQHQSNTFYKHSKSDWRRTDAARRAPATESPGIGWSISTDTYFAHVYAVHKDIDDQIRANADSVFKLDKDSTEFVTNQLLLRRDLDWNDKFFKTGVWDTEYTGVASGPTASQFVQWDQATSDPIGDVSKWIIEFRKNTGFAPNIMVLGAHVMNALKQHPDIIDRIKFTQRGIVTEDLIATLFDVKKLYTSYATNTAVAQINDMKAQDAAATYSFNTNPLSAALFYAPSTPGLLTPSAGYTFTWNGYLGGNSQGIRVKRFRMEHIAADRVEAEMTYDQKVVSSDMGIFLNTVVADPTA